MFRKKFGFDNQSLQKPNESINRTQISKEDKSINSNPLSDVLE
ncbi:hypothetical protein [Cyclobacterium xiamenense]|jgi:hypothetical protein